jgi:hypothetical protein
VRPRRWRFPGVLPVYPDFGGPHNGPRPKTLEPKYRHHKSSGQAYVVIDGKDVWLGQHGTAASRKKYFAVVSEWIARDRQGPPLVVDAAGPTPT